MGGGTGRLPGRDVKRDLAMHKYMYVWYIYLLSHSVYMHGKNFAGTFFVLSAGFLFVQPGPRRKRDNFVEITKFCCVINLRWVVIRVQRRFSTCNATMLQQFVARITCSCLFSFHKRFKLPLDMIGKQNTNLVEFTQRNGRWSLIIWAFVLW